MGGQNNSTLTKPIHVDYSVGFDYSTPAATRVATNVSTELSHTPYIATVSGPISVQMQGRTAILTGSVGTDHARDLAAQAVLLRTRIDQIQNDLQVRSARSTAPCVVIAPGATGPKEFTLAPFWAGETSGRPNELVGIIICCGVMAGITPGEVPTNGCTIGPAAGTIMPLGGEVPAELMDTGRELSE